MYFQKDAPGSAVACIKGDHADDVHLKIADGIHEMFQFTGKIGNHCKQKADTREFMAVGVSQNRFDVTDFNDAQKSTVVFGNDGYEGVADDDGKGFFEVAVDGKRFHHMEGIPNRQLLPIFEPAIDQGFHHITVSGDAEEMSIHINNRDRIQLVGFQCVKQLLGVGVRGDSDNFFFRGQAVFDEQRFHSS